MGYNWYIEKDNHKQGFVEFSYENGKLSKIELWEELDNEDMKSLGEFLIAQSKLKHQSK